MAQRIGLYGGSFDPVHHGHLLVARFVAEALALERVVFLPSASPPHKDGHTLAPAEDRAKMVELAIADEPLFEFSAYDLTRSGPSYTFDTVGHFREIHGVDALLHWIIGADSLADLPTWHRAGELVDACRIVTAARAGWQATDWAALESALGATGTQGLREGVLETPIIEISATEIRKRCRRGLSIRSFVPEPVRDHIESRTLYR